MHVLFCFISCNVVLGVIIVLHFNPHELISLHKRQHESKIGAPHHDESEDNHQNEELVFSILSLFISMVISVFKVHIQLINSVNAQGQQPKYQNLHDHVLNEF